MKGNPPTIFTGDRSKSGDFLREFKIYCMANSQNNSMLVPLNCIGLAISFIHGPMVNDWVEHMMNQINRHLAQGINPCYNFSSLPPSTCLSSRTWSVFPFVSHVIFPSTVTLLFIITCRRGLPFILILDLDSSVLTFLSPTTCTILRLMPVVAGPSQALFLYLTVASTMTKP